MRPLDQIGPLCELEWPSSVSGGMNDAPCGDVAVVYTENKWLCADCWEEVTSWALMPQSF